MDDMGVLSPLLMVFVAGGDAQGSEVAAAPQFREAPAGEGWLKDCAVVF
jgi:hypothetical protein